MKLTERQKVFVDKLPEHNWIIVDAGTAAGFTRNYAKHRLPAMMLSCVALKTAIEAKHKEIAEQAGIKAEKIISALSTIAFNELLRLPDRLKALELLGKHLRLFADVREETHKIETVTVTAEQERSLLEARLARLQAAQDAPVPICDG